MGYVLHDGKRYYQDGAGHLTLDNVSQSEADRRETQSARTPFEPVRRETGPFFSVRLILGALVLAVLLLIGALVRNHRYESPAEKAINEYMTRTEGISGDSSQ